MAQQDPPNGRFGLVSAAVSLSVLVAIAWANSVGGGPIFDDHFLVVGEDCFRHWEGLVRILQFEPYYACGYRPIRFLSYGVDLAVFGDRFSGHHVGNIVRHAASAVLALLLARRLFRDDAADAGAVSPRWAPWGAAVAVAALWALHPVQTDSVSYVSGRRDILVGLWTFAAVGSAMFASRRGGLFWLVPLWATLFAFLSKESAVVIPVLFLLWTIRGDRFTDWLRGNLGVAISVGVGLLLSFVLVLWRGVFASHSQRHFEWWGGDIGANFATVAALQIHYLQHVFLAHPLIGDYRADTIALASGFGDPRAIVGLGLVFVLLAVAFACRARRPLIAYGIAWYFVALAPMSHLIPHHELFAEHYLYVPLFGACLALVDAARWGVERASDPLRWGRIAMGGLAAILAVMVLRVVDRNRDFADERAYYEAVVEVAPQNRRAAANLANIYADAEAWDAALYWFEHMRPLWTPGGADERQALLRGIEVARRAERPDLAWASAQQLAAHHPDIGAGHRYVAEMAFEAEQWAIAWQAASAYVRVTRGPGGSLLLARIAATSPGPSLEDVRAAAQVAAVAHHVDEEVAFYFGPALDRRDASVEAVAWWLAHRPPEPRAAYDEAICTVSRRTEGTPPAFCDTP